MRNETETEAAKRQQMKLWPRRSAGNNSTISMSVKWVSRRVDEEEGEGASTTCLLWQLKKNSGEWQLTTSVNGAAVIAMGMCCLLVAFNNLKYVKLPPYRLTSIILFCYSTSHIVIIDASTLLLPQATVAMCLRLFL